MVLRYLERYAQFAGKTFAGYVLADRGFSLRSGFVRALALSLYFPLTFPLCNRFWIRERFKINKKLAKLGDAISISKSETINDSPTDWQGFVSLEIFDVNLAQAMRRTSWSLAVQDWLVGELKESCNPKLLHRMRNLKTGRDAAAQFEIQQTWS